MSGTPPLKEFLNSLRDDPDRLIALVLAQAKENEALREEIARLKKEKDELNRRLEEAQRTAHRQAAPFRIDENKRKKTRKKSGRPKGHAGAYRRRPESVDQTIEVPLAGCPHCGGAVGNVTLVEQFIEDIPPIRPHVTRLRTYCGECAQCGEVRSTHPLQVSTATGAAGTHLGPNALALGLELTQQHGLERRKTCRVLKSAFGLSITPGGLVQATHRLADKLQGAHAAIRQGLREAWVAYLDETGWWVGGPGWWLWVGTHADGTVFAVRFSRGREVVHELVGEDFQGVLVSDCLSIYDNATALQHKCYAHHHKAIAHAIKHHPHGGQGFLQDMRRLLHDAQALKIAKPHMAPDTYATARRALQRRAEQRLQTPGVDPLEQAIANRLRKQQDHLFTFLDHDAVEATNNRAERQLRPAVIARKLSCGNRTPRGALTWEILATVAATAAQCGESFRHIITNTARLPPPSPPR